MSKGRAALGGRRFVALHGFGHYVWRYQLAPLLKVVALLRRIWALGVAERVVLISVIGLAAAAALTLMPVAPAPVLATVRSGAHLGLFVLIWSVALAAAAAQRGPLALAIVTPWLVFYQVLAAGALVGTPTAVLPILWIAWIFLAIVRSLPSRRTAAIWWCLAAAGTAYVTAGPSGLRRWLGWSPLQAQALVASAVGVSGALVLYVTRARPRPRVGFTYPLTGALLVLGVVISAAALRDWAYTVEWTGQMIGDAGAIVVLFWMWIGGRAGAGSLHFAEWGVRQAARIVPPRVLIAAAPAAVAATALFEWLALRRAVPPGSELRTAALAGHLVVSIATAGWLGRSAMRRRLTHGRVLAALIWWSLAWLVMQGLRAGGDAVVASRESAHSLAGVTLIVLVIGLVSELGTLERAWTRMPDERIRRQLGFVATAVGCAVVLSTMPGGLWQETRTLMVLAGLAHLALPVALYERVRPRLHERALENMKRAAMFAAGYATALIVMAAEPRRAVALLAALPVLWGGLALLRRSASTVGRAGGALAGALFGGGVIAGWMMPYPPTLPFVPVPAWIVLLRDWGQLGRPPLTWQHASLVTAAWLLGGGLGWLMFRRTASPEAPSAHAGGFRIDRTRPTAASPSPHR